MTEEQSATKRLLINSLPKSGTHLLAKAVEILGYKEHFETGEVTETPLFFNYREVKKRLQHQTESDQKISIGALTPMLCRFRNFSTLVKPDFSPAIYFRSYSLDTAINANYERIKLSAGLYNS